MGTVVRVRTIVESERLHLPELAALVGERVEILVIPESMIHEVREDAVGEDAVREAGPAGAEAPSGEAEAPVSE